MITFGMILRRLSRTGSFECPKHNLQCSCLKNTLDYLSTDIFSPDEKIERIELIRCIPNEDLKLEIFYPDENFEHIELISRVGANI